MRLSNRQDDMAFQPCARVLNTFHPSFALENISLQKHESTSLCYNAPDSAMSLLLPFLCYYHFDSRDANFVIEACRTQIPDESGQCYFMIRCILDNVPSEINARWSAGASILAFIPTIVALMSNSIQETISIADESVILAVALSLSSITAFNSRFGDRLEQLSDILFKEKEWGHTNIHTALWALENLMAEARKPHRWWQKNNAQIYATSLIALIWGAGVWNEVYEITRYGIIVFACPIKVNVAIWVAFSQLLALLNVLCRSVLFEFHTIQIRKKEPRQRAARPNGNMASRQVETQCSTIVLRCPRDTSL